MQKIYKNLVKEKGQVITIANGSHKLFSPTNAREEHAKQKLFQEIIDFLTKTRHAID